jgi:hypothetical protein
MWKLRVLELVCLGVLGGLLGALGITVGHPAFWLILVLVYAYGALNFVRGVARGAGR